jgi:hypothetical protein
MFGKYEKMYIEYLSENPKGRHNLEELSVDERTILK